MYAAISAFMAAGMVFYLRRDLWSMADSVNYSGESITVKRWTVSETIPLTKVRSVTWKPYIVGSIVTLELSQPSAFGAQVRFYAPDIRKVPSITRDLEAFAARVQSGNRGHAA